MTSTHKSTVKTICFDLIWSINTNNSQGAVHNPNSLAELLEISEPADTIVLLGPSMYTWARQLNLEG